MAKVYYPKPLLQKLTEGAVAGLIAGAVVAILFVLYDLLAPNRSWWSTISIMGQIGSPARETNTGAPDVGPLVLGAVVHFAIFALLGAGLVYYLPLFRRFKINMILGGAVYGAFVWFSIFLVLFGVLVSNFAGRENEIVMLVACVIGGAIMGWWLSRYK